MPLLAFLITWSGYSLLTWGVATVRGCNVTWTQVSWPGKFTGCNPDGSVNSNGSIPDQSPLNTQNQNIINNAANGASQGSGQTTNPKTRGVLGQSDTSGPPSSGLG